MWHNWQLTEHKNLEVEVSFHPRPGFWLGISLEFVDRMRDHTGFYFELNLIWLYFTVQLYDDRHADDYSQE